MSQPASFIALEEVDAERALLGTFFNAPETFAEVAGEISPAWFSDPIARYMFEECVKLQDEGHTLSTPVVISMLPEDLPNGLTRSSLYANIRMSGLPAGQVGGLVSTLKDRWARRQLLVTADALKLQAATFGASPYELAQEAILTLDGINATRGAEQGATLQGAATALLTSLKRPEALRGVSTGLAALDKKLNGYKAGQLYVIAGRPGMGKSAFMCSSLRRTAENGVGVGVFSLEMTGEEVAARCIADIICDQHSPGFGDILAGRAMDHQYQRIESASETFAGLPLHIDSSPRLTMSEIAARSRQLKAKLEAGGRFLGVICIDHMGLVTPSDRYRGNKVAEAGEVSGACRALAKELDCCVVLLCQLSREVEKRDDKKPVMADLRWSGEIEQDAHVVAFLYREHYYLQNDPQAMPHQLQAARFKLDFLIRKNRNGETGDVNLWCSIAHSAVRDE